MLVIQEGAISIPALIIAAPYIMCQIAVNDFSLGNYFFTAAMVFDIVVYAYILERLSTYYANWKKSRRN